MSPQDRPSRLNELVGALCQRYVVGNESVVSKRYQDGSSEPVTDTLLSPAYEWREHEELLATSSTYAVLSIGSLIFSLSPVADVVPQVSWLHM